MANVPEEDDFFEKYLRNFQATEESSLPSLFNPFIYEDEAPCPVPRETREDSHRSRAGREATQDTIYPFANGPPPTVQTQRRTMDEMRAIRKEETIYPFAHTAAPAKGYEARGSEQDAPRRPLAVTAEAWQAVGLPLPPHDLREAGSWRLEMEAQVPSERQSMMSEYGPMPKFKVPEPEKPARPLPPPPVLSGEDVFTEIASLPAGVMVLQESAIATVPVLTEHTNKIVEEGPIPAQQHWCGPMGACREGRCLSGKSETCVRCRQPVSFVLDHRCPKCSAAVCVHCVAKFPVPWFRCVCGDQEANQKELTSKMWMINAYHSTAKVMSSIGNSLAMLSVLLPCRSQDVTEVEAAIQLHAGTGRLDVDAVVPDSRTRLPALQARSERSVRPGYPAPPPPPCDLPSLLGRPAPMNYFDSDPFKTRLPGDTY